MDKLNQLKKIEKDCAAVFDQINDRAFINEQKVLDAFRECRVALTHMNGSSGYGYDDTARPKLCELYAKVLGAQRAFVSPNITCGTHALYLALSAVLRPGDVAISVTGAPYDTLSDCIFGEGNGSLKDFGIEFQEVPMLGDEVDFIACKKAIKAHQPKLIYIQRSRGYSTRQTLTIAQIEKIIKTLKPFTQDAIFMVDNCYGEFVETCEPTAVGADLIAGSLIKNIGGGLAPTGGYVAGRSDLVELAEKRLTAPSLGAEVGSYNASYLPFFEGLFIAPHVVGGVLKGNVLLGKVAENLGLKTSPKTDIVPQDIIRTIEFGEENALVKFIQNAQKLSPIDSFVVPMPWDMPGYTDKVVMAAGAFVQGSSIEFSCDAPVRAPFIAYMQGGLTYEHIKIIALNMLENA